MIKARLSTKAAAGVAAIAVMATVGIMGGGIGQQQIALAQLVNCTPIQVLQLGVRTCLQEEVIDTIGPGCTILRLDPRLIPAFENFDLGTIIDFCG